LCFHCKLLSTLELAIVMPAKITLNISACAHNIQDNLSCLTEKFSRVLISRFSDMQNKSIVLAIFPVEP